MTTPHDNQEQDIEQDFSRSPKPKATLLSEDTIKSMIRLGQILRKIHLRLLSGGQNNNEPQNNVQ